CHRSSSISTVLAVDLFFFHQRRRKARANPRRGAKSGAKSGDRGAVEKVPRLLHGREKQGQTRFSNCRKSSQSLFFAYVFLK
ncbi:MAG: hypothetical protein NTZ09_13865, partial [Candidatus Hydrogenedentes bacterium]|nr:hypothetical protein [Candidatus Hydrogenedentota bacterium]